MYLFATKQLKDLIMSDEPYENLKLIDAENSAVLHVIPDWFKISIFKYDLDHYRYEQRYTYTYKYVQDQYGNDVRVVGSRGCPIALANATLQGFHHGIGIVDRFHLADIISVIPQFQIFHRGIMPLGQHYHLLFSESIARSKIGWIYHRILAEVVQRRLCIVFLYRQDASKVRTGKDGV